MGILAGGILVALNITGTIGKASLTKSKQFASQLERGLAISQVGKWSFEGNANDTSGYGNDGTVNGSPVWQDEDTCDLGFGGCLEFDGSGEYIEVIDSSSLAITDEITIAAWVQPNFSPGTFYVTVSKIQSSYPQGWQFVWHKDQYFYFYAGNGVAVQSNKNVIKNGEWSHIAVTYKSQTKQGKIWVNGKDVTSLAYLRTINSNTQNLVLGARADTKLLSFNGFMDDVQIYNEALTLSQIQHLYASGLINRYLAYK